MCRSADVNTMGALPSEGVSAAVKEVGALVPVGSWADTSAVVAFWRGGKRQGRRGRRPQAGGHGDGAPLAGEGADGHNLQGSYGSGGVAEVILYKQT